MVGNKKEKGQTPNPMARQYGRKPKRFAGKRAPKRRTARPAGSTGYQVAALLGRAGISMLKRKLGLNTELKYVDVSGTTTATGTLVTRITSPTIPQGATVGGRSGAGVRVTKVEQRIAVYVPAAATAPCNLRVITCRHKHQGTPAVADVLQVTTDLSSPIHNNIVANHIELISDQTYSLGTATGGSPSITIVNEFSRANWQMEWTDADTTGVAANLINGAIVTMWMVDNVTTAPVFTSTNRYWYVDN